uniref:RNA polymerase II elongation factor ELL N-terminal domain-containing protein n=1 Tax=Gasterosteus aculeatus aculeatus TaxID=481459 RepID=A0AAQ4P7P6_GASAC
MWKCGMQSVRCDGPLLPWLRPPGDVAGRALSRESKAALIAGQREKPAMASLSQEHRYGLSCGRNNRNSPNRTLYHVKLTDTAIRALEAYQKLKISLPSEPSICFKGNQGHGPVGKECNPLPVTTR